MAKVINGETKVMICGNESPHISARHLHRLSNPEVIDVVLIDVVLIEVQAGRYLGKDDIIRFKYTCGRA